MKRAILMAAVLSGCGDTKHAETTTENGVRVHYVSGRATCDEAGDCATDGSKKGTEVSSWACAQTRTKTGGAEKLSCVATITACQEGTKAIKEAMASKEPGTEEIVSIGECEIYRSRSR